MKKKASKPIDKNAWMNTYSDMVTLLLCFFVLLFASSNIDSEKWQILVRSLNPKAAEESQIANMEATQGDSTALSDGGDELLTDDETFDQLYWSLEKYVTENNLTADIGLFHGPGYTFIVFRNNIFFDGDQYYLKPGGRMVLDHLCDSLKNVAPQIARIKIFGHTNQADPNKPNALSGDQHLSSDRADEVYIYIAEKNIIDRKKLEATGFGQTYPIAPFVNEEDRQKNRRVEILIAENGSVTANLSLDEIYEQIDRDADAYDIPGMDTEEDEQNGIGVNNPEMPQQ